MPVYNAMIEVSEVEQKETEVVETLLSGHSLPTVSMEEIIKDVHKTLQEYPEAAVEMGPKTKNTKLIQLGDDLRDMIRDNLPEAMAAFAPIHRTVHVRDKEMQS
jgi:hypothetical protein